MRNENSDKAHHFLHGAVRVIEERSFLMHRKFVREGFSRCRRFLADPRHAVLLDWHFQPVPVQRSTFRQAVLKYHANPIALSDLNRRSRTAAVLASHFERFPWN